MSLSPSPLPPASRARTLTILVADDSRIDRRIASSILEGRGHRVVAAVDGTEALEIFGENERSGVPFDVAVIDYQMPGLGGEELALALRAAAKTEGRRPLRVVLLSGAARDRSLAEWQGIDAALPKPLDPSALVAAIEGDAAPEAAANRASAPAVEGHVPAAAHDLDRVVFDLGEALARARGKRALLIELVKIFMEDSENYLDVLRQSVEAGNLEQVEKAAHRLKGSSANVSAQRAADAAERIEKTLRTSHALPEEAFFLTLEEEMGKARKALAGFLAQNGS